MRLLFTFAGGSGHLEPLIPLARAASALGHSVAFAGRPRMVAQVEALGFPAFPAGSDTGLTPVRRPLLAPDPEREDRGLRDGFARRIARERATDLLALCAAWRPDLLVCEETDFGGMVVAERLGLRHVTVLVTAAGSFVRKELLAGALDEVRDEHGLPSDPGLEMLNRGLVLSPFPPSFRDPAFPLPATAHSFRVYTLADGEMRTPPISPALPHRAPLVYFTLGTVFNVESGDLFQRVLAGLRDLPVSVITTVGRDVDPAELGPQPAHIRVERYMPQSQILPRCDLVISHGGSGSVLGALAHGLPMVLLPMGADQLLNAERCSILGVAQVLDVLAATPQSVRQAVSSVLVEDGYRRAAGRLRDELMALPGPQHAIALIEQFAAT